jgi:hypothetical protein
MVTDIQGSSNKVKNMAKENSSLVTLQNIVACLKRISLMGKVKLHTAMVFL